MLSRFHLILERYGRTNGQTDGQICYINIARVSILTCDKNYMALTDVFIFQPHLFSEINLPWETVKI